MVIGIPLAFCAGTSNVPVKIKGPLTVNIICRVAPTCKSPIHVPIIE
jgi:hypothetical protein